MFCPKCGKADQISETYCRQCGTILPDLSKSVKRETPPEENIKVNTVLSLMTVIVCFTLAILLYIFVAFRADTHPLIYVTAGLLLAMGGWHIQTFIRSRKLKKQWKRMNPEAARDLQPVLKAVSTAKLLDEANFSNIVPDSVTSQTTRQLDETGIKASRS
ncbi:hypothetical protein BH10ACI2_BH10ACI2_20190 [soil metagenome]